MYTIGEFAQRVGVAVHTLQRWDREGRLSPKRTLSNRRYYTDDDLAQVLGLLIPATTRKTVVYCRVSNPNQKRDLINQRLMVEQFCAGRGIAVTEWIEEIGGGLNFQRKKFLSLIDAIVAGDIGIVIIAHKDRLTRFGFDLIEHLCTVRHCEIIVMNTESLSPEAEIVQDVMTIIHDFSRRLPGLRNSKKMLKEALAHGKDEHQSSQGSSASNA